MHVLKAILIIKVFLADLISVESFSYNPVNCRQFTLNLLTPSTWTRKPSVLRIEYFAILPPRSFIVLNNQRRWDDEIEQNSLRRAQRETNSGGSGIGETASGAVLGGLLGGPFGKLTKIITRI